MDAINTFRFHGKNSFSMNAWDYSDRKDWKLRNVRVVSNEKESSLFVDDSLIRTYTAQEIEDKRVSITEKEVPKTKTNAILTLTEEYLKEYFKVNAYIPKVFV